MLQVAHDRRRRGAARCSSAAPSTSPRDRGERAKSRDEKRCRAGECVTKFDEDDDNEFRGRHDKLERALTKSYCDDCSHRPPLAKLLCARHE